jgi:hypothetical protein
MLALDVPRWWRARPKSRERTGKRWPGDQNLRLPTHWNHFRFLHLKTIVWFCANKRVNLLRRVYARHPSARTCAAIDDLGDVAIHRVWPASSWLSEQRSRPQYFSITSERVNVQTALFYTS